jgi:misacylated tRNA(Ala) deacylase
VTIALAAKPNKSLLLDGMEMNDDDALPETDLVYQRDSGLRSVEATIVGIEPESRLVALDRTVVFPGGGGQPSDAGMLTRLADGQQWPVVAARKVGAVVWHEIGGDGPLPDVADHVRIDLDWERRYRLMRMHTALHVLCGVVFRDYGSLVTGGNMGPDRARMDFEMDSADFTPQRVAEIERRANEELRAGREVLVRILPRDEAFQIPDLIRTKINLLPEGISEVRTVEIVGLDLQADGGTHVQNTREVGMLRVVGTRSKGKANKRLEIELSDPTGSKDTSEREDQLA